MNWQHWIELVNAEIDRQNVTRLDIPGKVPKGFKPLSQSTMYDTLGGKKEPKVSTLASILAALGLSFEWLERQTKPKKKAAVAN